MSLESIRQQLDLEKRGFGYSYGPPELDPWVTEKLASYLVSQGVQDIRDLTLFDQLVTIDKQFGTAPDGSPIMGKESIRSRFIYDALSGHQLPEAHTAWSGPTGYDIVFVTGLDRWRVWMRAKFTRDGLVYFVPEIDHAGSPGVFSGLFEVAAPILPVISVGLALLAPGLGAFIGQAIMPTALAAAMPALVPIIGNVALGTALSGGNVEAAVIGAVTGGLGGAAGNAIAGATESALIGKLAASATSTVLRGGDVKSAIAGTLLAEGAKNVNINAFRQQLGDAWGAEADPGASSWEAFDWSEPVSAEWAAWSDSDPIDFAATGYHDPVYDAPAEIVQAPSSDWATSFDPTGMDAPANLPATVPDSSSWGDSAIVTLTNAALAAIKINAAYQASKGPQVRTSTVSAGVVKTGNPNGTVTVRNTTTGQSAVARPEVGVPYTLQDGRTIINNGNGTFSMIGRDGATQTLAYSSNITAGAGGSFVDQLSNVPTWVWGLGAAGLMFALRSSSSRGRA